jgi:Fic family protein
MLCRSDGSGRRFYSFARYVVGHRDAYYQAIERAQKGTPDITGWLSWFLKAIAAAVEESLQAVDASFSRSAFWRSIDSVALNERQRKVLMRLQGGFEGKLTTRKWAKMCKVSPDTALRDINDLIEKGILMRDAAGSRSTSYSLVAQADVQ